MAKNVEKEKRTSRLPWGLNTTLQPDKPPQPQHQNDRRINRAWIEDKLANGSLEIYSRLTSARPRKADDDRDMITYSPDNEYELPENLLLALGRMTSKLCVNCCSFFQGWICVDQYHKRNRRSRPAGCIFHPSLSSLRESVHSGCPLCKQLSVSLDSFCEKAGLTTSRSDSWTIRCGVTPDHLVALDFCLYDGQRCLHTRTIGDYNFKTMLFRPVKDGGLGPRFYNSNPETSTARSEASMKIVQSWYRTCKCRNWKTESRVLPTRLIRVRKPCKEFPHLYANLCSTEDLPKTTQYITLSHRWAEGDFLKLQNHNRKHLEQNIPTRNLHKVFKDAMYIATELNIQFVWIDSLCIIQDSAEDWTREAARMGDIYRYGEVNISATGYQDGEAGLFRNRESIPSDLFPVHFNCVMSRKEHRDVRIRGFHIQKQNDFRAVIQQSPLNSRGWVAQERELSPAIIHFTPKEIWWECADMIANETLPYGHEQQHLNICAGAPADPRIRSIDDGKREEVYAYWRSFVGRYSPTQLTFEKDRLAAVAGIARVVGSLLDDNFIAGFWERDLARSLTWKCYDVTKILSASLAPSWSWVSIGGLVSGLWSRSSSTQMSCVMIKVISDIDGFKSDLESGSLERSCVRGLAIRGPLRSLPADLGDNIKDSQGKLANVYMDEDKDKIIAKLEGKQIPEEHAWRLNGSTHLLPLTKDEHLIHGILLQQVPETQDKKTFRRSGVVEFSFLSRGMELVDEYFGILEEDSKYQLNSRFTEYGVQDIVLI